jgi:hypothetical protein
MMRKYPRKRFAGQAVLISVSKRCSGKSFLIKKRSIDPRNDGRFSGYYSLRIESSVPNLLGTYPSAAQSFSHHWLSIRYLNRYVRPVDTVTVVLNLPSFLIFMGFASGFQALKSPQSVAVLAFIPVGRSKVTRQERPVLE